MDIGLGRFLEMFEERFGRTATTVLVGIIGLAVIAFCVPLIWNNLIMPIYLGVSAIIQGIPIPSWDDLKVPLIGMSVTLAVFWLVNFIAWHAIVVPLLNWWEHQERRRRR